MDDLDTYKLKNKIQISDKDIVFAHLIKTGKCHTCGKETHQIRCDICAEKHRKIYQKIWRAERKEKMMNDFISEKYKHPSYINKI